jgi:periplasmic divalent cation tolerance protein
MSIILVYVTHENMEEAKKIADHLLKKRLIACANMFPVKSIYREEGKTIEGDEVATILKTRRENWDSVRDEIRKIHPYDNPCIVSLKGRANNVFQEWVISETTPENEKLKQAKASLHSFLHTPRPNIKTPNLKAPHINAPKLRVPEFGKKKQKKQ